MKQKIHFVLITLLLIPSWGKAQIENDDAYQLKFNENSFKEVGRDKLTSTAAFLNWDTDPDLHDDNGQIVACLRIKIENMALEDAKLLKARISSGTANISKQRFVEEQEELEVYCSPEAFQIEVYGANNLKSRPVQIQKLEEKHFYEITLTCQKQTTITIKTKPDDVDIRVDGKRLVGGKDKVYSGRHKVSFSRNGTKIAEDQTIVVSDENYSFEFDLRKKYPMHITSEPSDAHIYIFVDNDKKYFGTTPLSVELPEGTYTIIASKGPSLTDTTTLEVSDYNRAMNIRLVRKKRVDFYATYQGRRTTATLSIQRDDGGPFTPNLSEIEGKRQSFSLSLPYGVYSVRMSDEHNEAFKVIKVNEKSASYYELNIKPPKKKFVWPWQRDFDHKAVGLYIGYVQRTLQVDYAADGVLESVDPAWREVNRVTRGIRVGPHFQPCLSWGLGLYTGAFFEYYYSKTPESDKDESGQGSMAQTFTSFSEMAVSVPLHLYFRIPFNESFAISLHGGLDAEYYFNALYKDSDGKFSSLTPKYGVSDDDDFMYNHLNLGLGFGAGIQWGSVMLEATWHSGLTDHKVYSVRAAEYDPKSHFSKFSVSLSLLF